MTLSGDVKIKKSALEMITKKSRNCSTMCLGMLTELFDENTLENSNISGVNGRNKLDEAKIKAIISKWDVYVSFLNC